MPTSPPHALPDGDLARAWLSAIAQPPVRVALEECYAAAAAAIAERAPVCWASGRCCHFERAGHRLYVTGLEVAYLLANLPADLRPWPNAVAQHWLSTETSPARTCLYQHANLCTVHTIKPLACRLYFCDQSAQTWQQETLEELIARVRLLHDQHAVEYRYGEWHTMLSKFQT